MNLGAWTALVGSGVRDLSRQKLLYVPIIGMLVSALIIVLAAIESDSGLSSGEFSDLATGLAFVIGTAAAVYSAIVSCSLIADDRENGRLLMLGARPISRGLIPAARMISVVIFIAVALAATLFVNYLMLLIVGGDLHIFNDLFGAAFALSPMIAFVIAFSTFLSTRTSAKIALGTIGILAIVSIPASFTAFEVEERNYYAQYLSAEGEKLYTDEPSAIDYVVVAYRYVFPLVPSYIWAVESQTTSDGDFRDVFSDGGKVSLHSGSRMFMSTDQMFIPPEDPEFCSPQPTCFIGFEDAWERDEVDEAPGAGSTTSLIAALVATAFWALMASLSMAFRRNLM